MVLDQNIKPLEKHDIDIVLIRCLEGNASESDYKSAWDWIQQSDENRLHYERLRNSYLSVSVFKTEKSDKLKAENAWDHFSEKITLEKKRERTAIIPKLLRIAAVLILTFLLGCIFQSIWYSHKTKELAVQDYVIEAPRGAKSLVTLPDGTKIWLNAGSRITYNHSYNESNRDINLEGEAYFVVAKKQNLPFYVFSSGISIKAIGTAFNVKAYPEEDVVETTLVEGSISIESLTENGKKEKILLTPNQKAAFYKSTEKIALEKKSVREEPVPAKMTTKIAKIEVDKTIDTEYYTSWKDKRWVFREQKLGDFAIMLERIYDVSITFKDEALKNYSLSGSFDEVNLEQVLDAVRLTIPFDYTIEHNRVIFSINRNLKIKYDNLLKTRK